MADTTIKLNLPEQGDCLSVNVDESTMYIEIKRADVGYIIDVWNKLGDFVNSLTVRDDDLEV